MTRKSSTELHSTQARYQADFKPMTALQYRDACNKLGITVKGSAKVFGISRASAYRYAAGQWEVPETVAKLLRAMVKLGTTEI